MQSRNSDRLFPADPTTRDIARRLYFEVAAAPILSPHGHVDARLLTENERFPDPAALLVTPDHYVTRMLHAHGVPLDALGLARTGLTRNGAASPTSGRSIWRLLCQHWGAFAGTPVRYWMADTLSEVFGIDDTPGPATADAIYDELDDALSRAEFRPRALFDRFGIEVLATTDDPADDLAAHRALASDPTFTGRVIPTLRADRYGNPGTDAWRRALEELTAASGIDCSSYAGLLDALRQRRRFFQQHGATSTDSGVPDAGSDPLDAADAERIHSAARVGAVSEVDAVAYRRNLLYRFAEMATEDGLVMQLHAGVIRNSHTPTFAEYGPDTGHDLPAAGAFTMPLAPILRDFGRHPNLQLVLFTLDETLFAREIGPLAGFYPSVYAGAPWWFLDSPAAIARYRRAITDSAGFAKTSGFIDDTRAFCSIPARHDMSRRTDAAFLADLVATHQLDETEAAGIARALVRDIPRRAFKLED